VSERVGFYTGFVRMSTGELTLVRRLQVLFLRHLEKSHILLGNLRGPQSLNTPPWCTTCTQKRAPLGCKFSAFQRPLRMAGRADECVGGSFVRLADAIGKRHHRPHRRTFGDLRRPRHQTLNTLASLGFRFFPQSNAFGIFFRLCCRLWDSHTMPAIGNMRRYRAKYSSCWLGH
jgi:hypothetical protein